MRALQRELDELRDLRARDKHEACELDVSGKYRVN